MVKILSDGWRVARKDHTCCGMHQIHDLGSLEDYPAPACEKIEKGKKHYFQNIIDCGSVQTWRSCKSCLAYIQEHELYED